MKSFFFAFFIIFFGFVLPAQALEIQDVRFGTHPDKTRMVIDLNQPTVFRSFVLPKEVDKPYRLVVDFPDFEWKAGSIKKLPQTSILDVRTGALNQGVRRVVIDLDKPLILNSAFIIERKAENPNRLVIDFKTVSADIFSKTERKTFGTLKENNNEPIADLIKTFQDSQGLATIRTVSGIPLPPKKPSLSSTASKPVTPLRKKIIVVDAGHGGNDPGAVGSGRLKEKNITLAAARELKRQLESTGRFQVYLTRENDYYIKLHKRVAIARMRNADLFISLHADSIDKPNVRGASIYTLSDKASDAQTAKLAARENQADLIAGVDLSHEDKDVANILLDLAMRDTMNQSKFFANTVVDIMNKNGVRILERPHRFAGFAVLKAPDVPSVLFEMGFMSNNSEARLLNTNEYRQKIASALVDSIKTYFDKVQQNSLN